MSTFRPPRIRSYRAEDREDVIAILVSSDPWRTLGYTAGDWQSIGTDPGRETYVADEDGVAVGVAVVRRRFLLGDYLELFAVAETARRRGVGRALVAHLEAIVFARGANVFLCVSDFNTSARDFYRALGYTEVGALDDLLVAGRSEILMRKTTGPGRTGT